MIYEKVNVRVLKPFWHREMLHTRKGALPLSDLRQTEVGEQLTDVIEPDARSWEALGWVEVLK